MVAWDELSPAQEMQDASFLAKVNSLYIEPLHLAIMKERPDFEALTYSDRLCVMAALDQRQNGEGDTLPLGGEVPGGWLVAHAGVKLGTVKTWRMENGEEVSHYVPLFVVGPDWNRHFEPRWDVGSVARFLDERGDEYERLPIPYKAALLALLLQQNIVTNPLRAAMYVLTNGRASIGEKCSYRPWHGGDGRYKGWNVRLRDFKPGITQLQELGRELTDQADALIGCYGEGTASDEAPRHRRNQDRTDALVAFIDDYLPSIGLRVGQDGFTYEDAQKRFEENYPDYPQYASVTSFRKSYQGAKKRREGR
ncbi:MAG: hypothetical protein Q4C36_02545 [Coriobacteriia bacterium]|nr:hypothetical protein [Coriobacteriia bacterium]